MLKQNHFMTDDNLNVGDLFYLKDIPTEQYNVVLSVATLKDVINPSNDVVQITYISGQNKGFVDKFCFFKYWVCDQENRGQAKLISKLVKND